MKPGYVYIMTNKRHTVLYIGCTSNIVKRVKEHREHKHKGSFTDKYNCEHCVYYEVLPDYLSAIKRENRMKKSEAFGKNRPNQRPEPGMERFGHLRKSLQETSTALSDKNNQNIINIH